MITNQNNNNLNSSSSTPLEYYLTCCRNHNNCRAHTDVVRMLTNAKSFSDITEMDFSSTIVGHANFEPLLDILRRCTSLKVLLFPSNSIDNDRAIKLCDAVEENTQLVRLVLSGNPISDLGGKRIAKLVTVQNGSLVATLQQQQRPFLSATISGKQIGVAGDFAEKQKQHYTRTASSDSRNGPQLQQPRENFLNVDVSSTHMNYGLMRRISSSVPIEKNNKNNIFEQYHHQDLNVGGQEKIGEAHQLMNENNKQIHGEENLVQQQSTATALQHHQFYALEVLWSVAAKELVDDEHDHQKKLHHVHQENMKNSSSTSPLQRQPEGMMTRSSAQYDDSSFTNLNQHNNNNENNASRFSFSADRDETLLLLLTAKNNQVNIQQPQKASSSPKTTKLSIPVVASNEANNNSNNNRPSTPTRNNNNNKIESGGAAAVDHHHPHTPTNCHHSLLLETTTPTNNNNFISPFQNLQQLDREEREKYLGSGLPCLVQCIRTSPSQQQQ